MGGPKVINDHSESVLREDMQEKLTFRGLGSQRCNFFKWIQWGNYKKENGNRSLMRDISDYLTIKIPAVENSCEKCSEIEFRKGEKVEYSEERQYGTCLTFPEFRSKLKNTGEDISTRITINPCIAFPNVREKHSKIWVETRNKGDFKYKGKVASEILKEIEGHISTVTECVGLYFAKACAHYTQIEKPSIVDYNASIRYLAISNDEKTTQETAPIFLTDKRKFENQIKGAPLALEALTGVVRMVYGGNGQAVSQDIFDYLREKSKKSKVEWKVSSSVKATSLYGKENLPERFAINAIGLSKNGHKEIRNLFTPVRIILVSVL